MQIKYRATCKEKQPSTMPSETSWSLEVPQQLHFGEIPVALASQSSFFTLQGKLYIPAMGGSREGKALETGKDWLAGRGLEAVTEGVSGS